MRRSPFLERLERDTMLREAAEYACINKEMNKRRIIKMMLQDSAKKGEKSKSEFVEQNSDIKDTLVTVILEIDDSLYVEASDFFSKIGTSVEAMSYGFISLAADPQNDELLSAYLDDSPMEENKRDQIRQMVFDKAYDIALTYNELNS